MKIAVGRATTEPRAVFVGAGIISRDISWADSPEDIYPEQVSSSHLVDTNICLALGVYFR